MSEEKIALIDLGSNSCRMTIYYIENGQEQAIKNYRDYVRLSEGLAATGKLQQEPIKRTLSSLQTFQKTAEREGCLKIIALATEAVRAASNQAEFKQLILQETGIKLQVLSGDDEAYFDYIGSKALAPENGIFLDVGGGSFELIAAQNGTVTVQACVPEGSVVTTDRFLQDESAILPHFTALFQTLLRAFPYQNTPVVGLGGTIRAAYHLISGEKLKKNDLHGAIVSRQKLQALYESVQALSREERKTLPIVGKERGDILLAGLAPFAALCALTKTDIILSNHGIRDGYIKNYVQNINV